MKTQQYIGQSHRGPSPTRIWSFDHEIETLRAAEQTKLRDMIKEIKRLIEDKAEEKIVTTSTPMFITSSTSKNDQQKIVSFLYAKKFMASVYSDIDHQSSPEITDTQKKREFKPTIIPIIKQHIGDETPNLLKKKHFIAALYLAALKGNNITAYDPGNKALEQIHQKCNKIDLGHQTKPDGCSIS